jgi:hypothetical protein
MMWCLTVYVCFLLISVCVTMDVGDQDCEKVGEGLTWVGC